MGRRTNGDGSIYRRKDGRWMGRYYVILPDGTPKRKQIIHKDRQVVADKMREEMFLAAKGKPVIEDNRTLGEYMEYWLVNISAPRIRKSTNYIRGLFVRKHIIETIGDIKLSALRPQHVLQMLAQLENKGASKYTQKRAKQLLSTALKDAMKMEIVHRNITQMVDTPKHKSKERSVFDKAQVQQFLAYVRASQHRLYPLFEIMLYYGIRLGEALGLRWQDIDFEKNEIRIRQALARVGSQLVFDAPKTESSIRDLPLLPNIRDSLIEHRAKEMPHSDDLLFHSKRGNPVNARSLLTTFKRLCRQTGLPEITLHETRHTAGTLLKDSGVDPKDAQMILGHSDIRTTLQIYTHSSAKSKTAAMNTLAAHLSS